MYSSDKTAGISSAASLASPAYPTFTSTWRPTASPASFNVSSLQQPRPQPQPGRAQNKAFLVALSATQYESFSVFVFLLVTLFAGVFARTVTGLTGNNYMKFHGT